MNLNFEPPTKKRKTDNVTPAKAKPLQVTPSWIVPTFQPKSTTITPNPTKSSRSLIEPPKLSFGFEPPSSSSPLKPLADPRKLFDLKTLPKPSPTRRPAASSVGTLQTVFHPPKPPETPFKKSLQPLFPPPNAITTPDRRGTTSKPPPKPHNQTPLTTRLAHITATSLDDSDDTQDLSSIRSAIAEQARQASVKHEEKTPFQTATTAEVDHMLSGLNVSPERPGRAGARKGFVRNGIAERASHLINRAENDFSLWTHEMARALARNDSTSVSPHPKPPQSDLRVLIMEVLTDNHIREISPNSRPVLPPPYCLTRCRTQYGTGTDEELQVLFSFGMPSSSPLVSPVKGLERGKTILLWKPWIELPELSVPPPESHQDAESKESESRSPRVVLCSRFMIRGA